MARIVNSPIFHFIRDFFAGDNVAHYLPAKYLWTVCNVTKAGFYQPVYDFRLEGPITLDFLFYPEQPQHRYFQKPNWINEFVLAENVTKAREITRHYDFCVNNYRYRGAKPPELNWGNAPETPAIDLYLVAYTYRAIYDERIYLDDLALNAEYEEYLGFVRREINPEKRPVIALHHRGNDPWNRHLSDSSTRSEQLLRNLLEAYPEHQIVLLGESWRYHRHPRVRYLDQYFNLRTLRRKFTDYSACLQYILSAFFCRDADLVLFGISGFSLFVESIRPANRVPPIPVFWGPKTFTGVDTCMEMFAEWGCSELSVYRKMHPEDKAFQFDVHHFLYHSREESLLKPYCLDYPNDLAKVFALLETITGVRKHSIEQRMLPERPGEKIVNWMWRAKPHLWRLKRIFQVVFREKTLFSRLGAMLRRVKYHAGAK